MSPLNMDSVTVFKPFTYHNGDNINVDKNHPTWTPADLKAAINTPGQLQTWENQKAFLLVLRKHGLHLPGFLYPP